MRRNMSMPSNNIIWHHATVTRQRRELQNGHRAVVLWFTGLPSSGKSTIAHVVEENLHQMGCRTFVLDGDNVRHGLCADLGFSKEDRAENVRRIGEMVKLFIEAGVVAITAFISPFHSDRRKVRKLLKNGDFVEIFCYCPIEICEQRDLKGHYQKARIGEIKEFTGISSPYETPECPEIKLDTEKMTIKDCADIVIDYLIKNKNILILDNSPENVGK
jgi:adenylylsulfate kinase